MTSDKNFVNILARVLNKGKPNNDCKKKHTLNRTIRILKSDITCTFGLNLIKILSIDGKACNEYSNNNKSKFIIKVSL